MLRTSIYTGVIWLAAQICLCACAAASGSEGALWAVLYLGRAAFLGLCLRADSVCWSAVQRGADGDGKNLPEPRI